MSNLPTYNAFGPVEPSGPKRVRVPGRDDVGEVIDGGKNLGNPRYNMYCIGIHFPDTGEVVYYDSKRVEYIDD